VEGSGRPVEVSAARPNAGDLNRPAARAATRSPSEAKRREESRKHASQSAYVLRAAGTGGAGWFYVAAAVAAVVALLLRARSLPVRPRDWRDAPAWA